MLELRNSCKVAAEVAVDQKGNVVRSTEGALAFIMIAIAPPDQSLQINLDGGDENSFEKNFLGFEKKFREKIS